MDGQAIIDARPSSARHLPIEYVMPPPMATAFRIVGYENVERLNAEMTGPRGHHQRSAVEFGTLLFALWLFNRFLFVPVRRMVQGNARDGHGTLDLDVDKKGCGIRAARRRLRGHASQVRMRTNDLERLLDLDDSAILCFGSDGERLLQSGARSCSAMVSTKRDLDLSTCLPTISPPDERAGQPCADGQKRHVMLNAIRKDGSGFVCDAMIVRWRCTVERVCHRPEFNTGPAALLSSQAVVDSFQKNEQRMNAVEQSSTACWSSPGKPQPAAAARPWISWSVTCKPAVASPARQDRPAEQAVELMCAAWLAGSTISASKLDLAEASRICRYIIDKSTPTTGPWTNT